MTQQVINIGAAEDDGTGAHNRVAWDKTNQNFTELYAKGVIEGLWNYNKTSTDTSTSPVSGRFKTNSGNYRDATQIAIHAITIQGIDRTSTLRALLVGDSIQCQDSTNSAAWCRYSLQSLPVDHGSWFQLNVTFQTDGGVTSGDNQEIVFVFTAGSGSGIGAPVGAEYITSTTDATLTNERVLTDTATVTWDRTTAGQIKANAAGGGGGDVFLAGTNTFTAQNCFTGFPLVVGNTAPVGTSDLQVHGTSLQTACWANNGFGATHYFDKSRGTVGTQVAATIGDFLGDIVFRGSDGSAFSNAAIIRSLVNQAVSTGVVPGALQMFVADATGALVLCGSITPGACNFIGSTAAPVTGYVGEYLTNSASGVPLSGGYTATVSMSIPAGDWDIRGVVQVNQAAGSYIYINLHTGSATSSGSPDTTQTGIMTGLGDCWTSVGPFRKLLTTSTTYYLNIYSSTGSGSLVFGEIQVHRRH